MLHDKPESRERIKKDMDTEILIDVFISTVKAIFNFP